jgi:hypothetical protein
MIDPSTGWFEVKDVKQKSAKESMKTFNTGGKLLIPQVRPAHKYPISPWEMIHSPGGDNAVCM